MTNPELAARIAERVMGWRRVTELGVPIWTVDGTADTHGYTEKMWSEMILTPSGMVEIMEAMRAKGWYVCLRTIMDHWNCVVVGGRQRAESDEDTPMLAVAMAALKAVEESNG